MNDFYRKKPITIEAKQWTIGGIGTSGNWSTETLETWEVLRKFTNYLVRAEVTIGEPENEFSSTRVVTYQYFVYDRLHDSWIEFFDGDWIIKGIKGEFYPHNGELFPEVYDKVDF